MIIPMLCVTIFVILVVWFLLPRVARLMIHTPTAISIFRSEERFSRNAETDLVCRLLLEKKKEYKRGLHKARVKSDKYDVSCVNSVMGLRSTMCCTYRYTTNAHDNT